MQLTVIVLQAVHSPRHEEVRGGSILFTVKRLDALLFLSGPSLVRLWGLQ